MRRDLGGRDWGDGQDERQERREDRHERRDDRREDWQAHAEDHSHRDHAYYYGGYYYEDFDDGYDNDVFEDEVYDRLPCTPYVVFRNGMTYYKCPSAWFVRAVIDDNVVYVVVPDPG